MNTSSKKFDANMYAAALSYYGLPANYGRTFKQKPFIDSKTGEQQVDRQGKPVTTLTVCNAPKESQQGNAIWVQVNRPFEGTALTGNENSQYRYPKKAKNEDIQWIANITLDFEYPPNPSQSHAIATELAAYLIAQGLAQPGQPIEDTGAGNHISLAIPVIETTKDTAELWNQAVRLVVHEHIKPEFTQLVKKQGIEMDLGGFDISRVLSAPGTWRPYRPDKEDCDALKAGYLRRWLVPYVDSHYPERRECEKLASLIRDAFTRLEKQAKRDTSSRATHSGSATSGGGDGPAQWLDSYAQGHHNSDRSALFHTLVLATYRKYGEEVVYSLKEQINQLAGAKYNGDLEGQIKRSLTKAEPREEVKAKPEVIIGRQLPEMVDDAIKALVQAESENPTIFVRANCLIKVARDKKKGGPIIREMGSAEIRNALARTANYYRLKAKDDTYVKVPVTPPKDIVEGIASPENPSDWPFPVLDAIIGIPVMRPDGSILDKPGYDEATQLYYQPTRDLVRCNIPERPTKEDALAACEKLQKVIAEFPFATPADRANALGAMLTPFIRQAMVEKDDVPLASIDAASPGTGKGLLASVISILATGSRMIAMPAPDSEEEWDKKIFTELLEGNTLIVIDNIPGTLQSVKLETVLTTRNYKGRVLGLSKSAAPENRATWIATGNNIKLAGDLPERCYWIRMVAPTSNPEERVFTITDLMEYVTEHRCDLVEAILTMIRAWHLAARPKDTSLKPFRTYTNWSNTVGSILHFAGVKGFLTDRTARKNELDDERKQWTVFLRAWSKKWSSESIPVATIKKECEIGANKENNGGSDGGSEIYLALPEKIKEAFDEKPKSFSQIFGKALRARVQRRYGSENFYLERGTDPHANAATWVVLAGSGGSGGSDSYSTHGKNETGKNETGNFSTEPEFTTEMSPENSRHSRQTSQEKNGDLPINPPVKPDHQKIIVLAGGGSRESLPAGSPQNEEEGAEYL